MHVYISAALSCTHLRLQRSAALLRDSAISPRLIPIYWRFFRFFCVAGVQQARGTFRCGADVLRIARQDLQGL
eukprot:6189805-Pleurochrysis_carterae.AAC.5